MGLVFRWIFACIKHCTEAFSSAHSADEQNGECLHILIIIKKKSELSLSVIRRSAMEQFLTLVWQGGRRSSSQPGRINPGVRTFRNKTGLELDLDALKKKKTRCPAGNLTQIPRSSSSYLYIPLNQLAGELLNRVLTEKLTVSVSRFSQSLIWSYRVLLGCDTLQSYSWIWLFRRNLPLPTSWMTWVRRGCGNFV